MSLEQCANCGKELLTESDPYVVVPTRGTLVCIDCLVKTYNESVQEAVDSLISGLEEEGLVRFS